MFEKQQTHNMEKAMRRNFPRLSTRGYSNSFDFVVEAKAVSLLDRDVAHWHLPTRLNNDIHIHRYLNVRQFSADSETLHAHAVCVTANGTACVDAVPLLSTAA